MGIKNIESKSKTEKEALAAKDLPKQQAEKKNILDIIQGNKVWQVGITVFTIWALHSMSIVYSFHTNRQMFPTLERANPIGILIAALIAPCFEAYKRLFDYLFYGYFERILNPSKYSNDEEKERRTKKIVKYARGLIYYTTTSLFAFFAFRDQSFWPTWIGGSNTCPDIYTNAPDHFHIPYGNEFYLTQLGYHMWSFVEHFIRRKGEATYWEMNFHHALTVFLISYSFLLGEQPVGIIVLFIHDFSDIFVDADRLYNDIIFRKEWVINILHGLFIVCWIYFRIAFFSCCVILTSFYDIVEGVKYTDDPYSINLGIAFQAFMLTGLLAMHMYWMRVLLIIMYYQLFKKDRDPNFYDNNNKVESSPEKQKKN